MKYSSRWLEVRLCWKRYGQGLWNTRVLCWGQRWSSFATRMQVSQGRWVGVQRKLGCYCGCEAWNAGACMQKTAARWWRSLAGQVSHVSALWMHSWGGAPPDVPTHMLCGWTSSWSKTEQCSTWVQGEKPLTSELFLQLPWPMADKDEHCAHSKGEMLRVNSLPLSREWRQTWNWEIKATIGTSANQKKNLQIFNYIETSQLEHLCIFLGNWEGKH